MPAKKKTVKRGGAGKTGAGQSKNRGSRGGGLHADRRGIAGLILLGVGILAFLCLLVPSQGGILQAMNLFFKGAGGRLCLLLPILLCCCGILMILGGEHVPVGPGRVISGCALFLLVETMLQLNDVSGVIGVLTSEGASANWPRFLLASWERSALNLSGGGAIGAILAWPLYKWFDVWGGMFVSSLLLIITLMVLTGVSLGPLSAKVSEIAADLHARFADWRENRSLEKEERAAEKMEEELQRKREAEEREKQRRKEAEEAEKTRQKNRAEKNEPRTAAENADIPADRKQDTESAPDEQELAFDFGKPAGNGADGRVSPFGPEVQAGGSGNADLAEDGTDQAPAERNPGVPDLDPAGYKNTPLYLHTDDEFERAGQGERNDPDFTEKAIAAFTGQALRPDGGEEDGAYTEYGMNGDSGEDAYADERFPETAVKADPLLTGESGGAETEWGAPANRNEPGSSPMQNQPAGAGASDSNREPGAHDEIKETGVSSGTAEETNAESASVEGSAWSAPPDGVLGQRRRRQRRLSGADEQAAAGGTEQTGPETHPEEEPEQFTGTVGGKTGFDSGSSAARTADSHSGERFDGKRPGANGQWDGRSGTEPAGIGPGAARRLDDTPVIVPKKDEHALPERQEFEYIKPPIDLLYEGSRSVDPQRAAKDEATGRKLIDTLKSFNVGAELKNCTHGPAITRYEIQPAPGVKVSRITSLADDIALNLASDGVRIEAPVPGKPVVGIEVPNEKIEMVRLRDVLDSESMRREKSPTAVALGKNISGAPVIADMAKMPHVLIAGATGSGKSVCINTIIQSVLFRATPQEVKLILIDPKVVELSVYNGIPHLLIPVVTDPKKASAALSWAVREMEIRYKQFESLGVRDIRGYNNKILASGETAERTLPKIILIIDELADLMMVAPGEVEDSICRLAQLARAAGIHLVIATQRPSVNVITGVIKANIPSRIAFAVSSQIDSRTILDGSGAEKLLGKGDMLYAPQGNNKPTRVQGCFVDDEEVQRVVERVKAQHKASYNQEVIEMLDSAEEEEKGSEDNAPPVEQKIDEVFEQAVQRALEDGQTSISMLQRRLRIGYARAGRLIDQMTDMGIIGEAEAPSKPRKTLITREEWERIKNASS